MRTLPINMRLSDIKIKVLISVSECIALTSQAATHNVRNVLMSIVETDKVLVSHERYFGEVRK